jgi:hypothetical protein
MIDGLLLWRGKEWEMKEMGFGVFVRCESS